MLLAADPAPVTDDPVLAGLRAGTVDPGPGVAGHGGLTAGDDDAGPAADVDGAATDPDPLEAPLADELAQDGLPVAVAAIGAVVDDAGVVDDTAGVVEDTGAVMVDGGLGEGVLVVGVVVVVVDALGGAGVAPGDVDGGVAGCGTTFVASVAPTPALADAAVHIRARNTNTAAKSTASSCLLRPTALAPAPVRTRYDTPALPEAHGPGHSATLPGRVHGREPHDKRGGGPASQPA
jgi:hypothetical protein